MTDKTYMFQYASTENIYEDTWLITSEEAERLWNNNYDNCINQLNRWERVQMCVRKDCKSNTSYHTVEKELDYQTYAK